MEQQEKRIVIVKKEENAMIACVHSQDAAVDG